MFPKRKAFKAKKRTIQNQLFLSEEVTFHYLTGGWLHIGPCLLEEMIRNFIQVFVDHNSLVVSLKRLGILDICSDTLKVPVFSKDI